MFVINLRSYMFAGRVGNDYGYYAGTYIKDFQTYPITDSCITRRTKKYISKLRAENMANKLRQRCGYIDEFIIEEVKEADNAKD